MHAPFELSPLIGPDVLGSEPITGVLLHADRVVLGTEKGSLLVFDLSAASTSTGPPSATLVSRHDGFSKKAIDQLGVIKELNGLVCLSGGDVSLYSFSDLALLSSFTAQTRASCSLFELSTSIRSSAASQFPQIHTTLALACKRRLLLLSWTDATWNPLVEVSLPHQIRGMAFTEEGTKLVAGFSTGEYGIVTLSPQPDDGGKATAELGELFQAPFPVAVEPTSRVGSLRGATSLPGFGALGGLGSAVGLGALPGALGKKLEKNGVVAVPRRAGKGDGKGKAPARNAGGREEKEDEATSWLWGKEWGWDEDEAEVKDEVLVVRDNMALPLDSQAKPRPSPSEPSHPATLSYPSPIDETVVLPPYVLSILSPPPPAPTGQTQPSSPSFSLAVHSVDTLSPMQFLSLPPRPVSPPASIADSTSSATRAPPSAAAKPPPPPSSTARHLTISPSSAKSPALVLTASPPTGSIATGGGFPTQTLWIASMRSWQDQLESLGAEGRWKEALSLLRRSTAPSAAASSLPKPLLKKLATLHALSLFRQKRYKSAIDAFIKLDVSPARVVALYDEAISGKVRVEEEGWEELFGGRTKEEVVKAREAAERKREEEEEQKRREQEERERVQTGSPAKGKKGPLSAVVGSVDDDDAASIHSVASRLVGKKSWLRESREGSADEGKEREAAEAAEAQARKQAKLAAADRSLAVEELIRYLTDRRQKYSLALSSLLSSSRPSPSTPRPPAPASELLSLPNVPLTDLPPDQIARAAQVVDTALFRAYLATKPVMVGPLCRIENWCEVEEVEELLMAKKKYGELLDLYNGKDMHERAVKLLRQMSQDEDDPEEKVDPTVRYLQKLGPQHVQVIYDASRWVFEQDKKAGLQIFIADLEEVESLPRQTTMAHLDKVGRDVCIQYLEHIIHELGEQGAEFHEKLIELYLAEVVQSKKATGTRDEAVYRKLLDLLESSTSYRADRILGRLPSEDMHEVRAVLLGRLGRHEGALQIYVYQLEDHQTAEQYCMRVYNLDESMRSTIFHLLLRLYLRPRPNHPLLFGPALSLLSTHAARIDPLEVFDLLPPLVSVSDIKVYLEKTLRRSGERRREAIMVKGVEKAWMEEKEREVVKLEERRVKISEGRACPVCSKRIGNSVIAVHNPRGEVTHYQCREQFMKGV